MPPIEESKAKKYVLTLLNSGSDDLLNMISHKMSMQNNYEVLFVRQALSEEGIINCHNDALYMQKVFNEEICDKRIDDVNNHLYKASH